MERFDSDNLRRMLHSLPDWKRVVFMAACCERMLPNYQSFSSATGYGDASRLRQALDQVWHWIETNQLPRDVSLLVEECNQQAPNTAEFNSAYTSAALDAANSVAIALEALGDETEDRAIEVASLARDTVDLFVQQRNHLDPNSPSLERQIAEDSLMQTELQKQKQSLELLKDQVDQRLLTVARMRAIFSDRSLPGNL